MAFRTSDSAPVWHGAADQYPEGNLGAQFGDLVVSTPNASVMYAPLCDSARALYLQEGCHFGRDDPYVHPQLYDPEGAYLLCVPTPTHTGKDSIMFHRLQKARDWQPDGGWTGLGRLKSSVLQRISKRADDLLEEVEVLVKDGQAGLLPTVSHNSLPNSKTKRSRWFLKHHLRTLATLCSFDECQLRWSAVQRIQIDLSGYIVYLRTYKALFSDLPTLPRPVDHTRAGCITTSFTIASEVYTVGLPVWFIYKACASSPHLFRRFLSPGDVDKLLKAQHVPPRPIQMGQQEDRAWISLRRPPDHVALWTGQATDHTRYRVMAEVFRGDRLPTRASVAQAATSVVAAPPPTTATTTPSTSSSALQTGTTVPASAVMPPPSTTSSTIQTPGLSSSASKRGRQDASPPHKRKRAKSSRGSSSSTRPSSSASSTVAAPAPVNRSRWVEPTTTFDVLPEALLPAANALEAERRSLRPNEDSRPEQVGQRPHGYQPHHSLFAAPDGGQIASMAIKETLAGAIANYIRFRPLVQYRIRKLLTPASSVKNLRAQDWRTILGLQVLSTKNENRSTTGKKTQAAENREKAFKVLRETLEESQCEVTFDIANIRSTTPLWIGEFAVRDDGKLPDLLTCRQVIWEMYELNFRSEFLILDHYMYDWVGNENSTYIDQISVAERRAHIVESMGSWLDDLLPTDSIYEFYPSGLCSSDRKTRLTAMRSFAAIMNQWVGVGALRDGDALVKRAEIFWDGGDKVNLNDILEWEEQCWRHYIRTHYHVIGRPPTLPRRMPLQDEADVDMLE